MLWLSARMCNKNEPITTDVSIAMRVRIVYHSIAVAKIGIVCPITVLIKPYDQTVFKN